MKRNMKIFLSVSITLLILVSGVSGYFIWDLTEKIEDLEVSYKRSLDEMDTKYNGALDTSDKILSSGIEDIQLKLDRYTESTEQQITETQKAISDNFVQIYDFKNTVSKTTESISDSVLPSQSVYEKVKQSIVRISYKGYLLGSGFIFTFNDISKYATRQFVTAYHVIEVVTRNHYPPSNVPDCTVLVTLSDGRTYRGDLIASCKELDIAILDFIPLQIAGSWSSRDFLPLTSLTLADSGKVRPGDPVFVIGSPDDGEDNRQGLKESMTAGIISQVNRSATIQNKIVPNLLQIDAAVNFGNSGGPLLNSNGEIIGMIIARINPLIGEGIGYAVSSNQLKQVVTLLSGNRTSKYFGVPAFTYEYPQTGITVQDITPKEIVEYKNTITSGAEVTAVAGLAGSAGVVPGDIIISLDDRPVRNSDEFYSFIAEYYSRGDTINLKIWRNGEQVSVSLTVL
jgi:S1-C subfamily serine protease